MICSAALWCTGRAVLDSDCPGIERRDCANGGGVSGGAGVAGLRGATLSASGASQSETGSARRFGVKAAFGNAAWRVSDGATMRQVRRIAGVGCLSALVAGAVVVAVSWGRISSVARDVVAVFDGVEVAAALQSVDALVEFIDGDRFRVSLVAYRLEDPESAIWVNPDVRRPLASTIKILVLAGYAEAVDEGRWSPLERVPLATVEVFFLPGTDGGAHGRAVEVYRERGWLDGSGAVSLRDVVWAMMAVSDNAATDYLLHRLGRERAGALPARLGLGGSDAPLPISGVFLSWAEAAEEPLAEAAWTLADRLHGDLEFRTAWKEKGITREVGVREQARLSDMRSPRGTAREYAGLMERVQRGELISAAASATMRQFLEWPMENEAIRREFSAYGTKSGAMAGVLTEVSYAAPRDATGGVAALFLEELPLAVWFTLSEGRVRRDGVGRGGEVRAEVDGERGESPEPGPSSPTAVGPRVLRPRPAASRCGTRGRTRRGRGGRWRKGRSSREAGDRRGAGLSFRSWTAGRAGDGCSVRFVVRLAASSMWSAVGAGRK